MCGISGIYHFQKTQNSAELVKKMNAAMAHRGPDNDGIFENDKIVLGHRRLSIIDLSKEANQPMSDNSERYTIVFNGEIYNFQSLKNQLPNYRFKTHSDSEVILALYMEYGSKCVDYLDGMFAFAVWDKSEQTLFLVRDRFGKKPLYYHFNGEHFIFASEIRALLASGLVSRKISKAAVIDFLRYQTVHAPNTLVEDIKMLMPGHTIMIKGAKIEFNKYWSVDKVKIDISRYTDLKNIQKNVKELLYASVEKRMLSDVPFGAFLSGGIDSSAVVGIMSQISNHKIRTFSVTFNEEKYSEARFARQIAQQFNTEHTEIKLTPDDFLTLLPEAMQAMDRPCGDGANTYVVSKVTKDKGVTMALSGLGGDEIFAGYDVFKRLTQSEKYKSLSKMPRFVKKGLANGLTRFKPGIGSRKIAEILKLNSWNLPDTYPVSRLIFMDFELNKLLKNNELTKNSNTMILSELDLDSFPFLSQISFAEISTYMQNVLLLDADQMSMASSLEIRVPFLDYQLAEYVFNVPDKFKYPTSPKKLLVDSLGFLPDEIVNRPKMGFSFPWEQWIRNELYEFCDSQIQELSKQAIFNSDEILAVWKRFLAHDKSVNWARIWLLVSLQHYISINKLEF